MKRDNLLIIGNGQCGNILADLLKDMNNRYTTIYINSSMNDLKGLKYANIDNNVFIYAGSDGVGRDRNKGNAIINNDKLRLASFLKNFMQFKYILVITSLGGGTGSGSTGELIKVVSMLFPNSIINLIGVLPSFRENNLELKNTVSFFEELNSISELINDIKFIDNNKRATYDEINMEAMSAINLGYSMLGSSNIGSIDENNLCNVSCCNGYGVVLPLESNSDNFCDSLNRAINDSVFSIPDNLKCLYGAINISENVDIENIGKYIKTEETLYITYGNKNCVALGGCSYPDTAIDEYESIIKERTLRKDNRPLKFNYIPKYNVDIKRVVESKEPVFINDEDIDDIFNTNNFRR